MCDVRYAYDRQKGDRSTRIERFGDGRRLDNLRRLGFGIGKADVDIGFHSGDFLGDGQVQAPHDSDFHLVVAQMREDQLLLRLLYLVAMPVYSGVREQQWF